MFDYVNLLITLIVAVIIILLLFKFTNYIDATEKLEELNGKKSKIERTVIYQNHNFHRKRLI